ncbi:MAG: ABC transporter substrate-binding protein [Halothece sp.]
MRYHFLFLAGGLFFLLIGCNQMPTESSLPPNQEREECVANYDPNRDYFPNKTELNYAEGFQVEYFNHYKVISVLNPWRNAEVTFQYVLVQCGTPIPDGFEEAQVVEVPVENVVSLSTTNIPHLEKLGRLDRLIAVGRPEIVNTPAVREKIEQGEMPGVRKGSSLNFELLLSLDPDLVMTFGTGNQEFDTFPKLIELGIPTGIIAEYMESSPLGQAEWIKFTALFFNQEEKAESVFTDIATRYEKRRKIAQNVSNRPTVLTGFNRSGTWSVSGGNSYVAQYLADAGANYLWAENKSSGSVPLDFEAVYAKGRGADYWLHVSQDWETLEEIIAQDQRYAKFQAIQENQVYNNDARLNANGGNDFWESGMVNPDVILADLIKILHPELLPEHELVYYRQLE